MKRMMIVSLVSLVSLAHAVDKPGRNQVSVLYTGNKMSFATVTVSSTTVTKLASYSDSRGSLTCFNNDSTYTVWLGSSSNITSTNTAIFPLLAQKSIEFFNGAEVDAIASTNTATSTVYCLTEN